MYKNTAPIKEGDTEIWKTIAMADINKNLRTFVFIHEWYRTQFDACVLAVYKTYIEAICCVTLTLELHIYTYNNANIIIGKTTINI